MKKPFYLLFILLLVLSCKKDKKVTMTISGTVSDGINGGGLSGASVALSYQKIENGVATTAFSTVGTYTTSSDGRYTFSFDKPSVIKYKIQLTRTNYFGVTEEINPDHLSTESENTRNYTMYPSATFTISIDNTNPINSSDQIAFQHLSESSGCPSCCNNSLKILPGMSVDTSFTCTRYGNTYVKFQWIVTKNSISNTFQDSVYCPTGQVTTYQINY